MTQDTQEVAPRFDELGLDELSLASVADVGYETPSPIQAEFIPVALTGEDVIGQARTGTGKTAAFTLPTLEKIDENAEYVQTIVLAPTRELSEQVAKEVEKLALKRPVRVVTVVGGRPMGPQIQGLQKGAQIVVGTPGRVIDMINRRHLDLSRVSTVILDEADRMLDIGFRPDIEKILRRCPTERQTLLLSATLPPPVEKLAQRYMRSPKMVDLSDDNVVTESVEQFFTTVDGDRKLRLLVHLLQDQRPQQCIVFVRTKRGAEKLFNQFKRRLTNVELIHGDLPQRKRDRVMKKFRSGEVRLLFATDVVGRGIDISSISHIVNFDIPEYQDDYVHRVGRTGRLSSDEKGRAYTFVTREQGDQLTSIEMRINKMLHEYLVPGFEAARPVAAAKHVDQANEEKSWTVDDFDDSLEVATA